MTETPDGPPASAPPPPPSVRRPEAGDWRVGLAFALLSGLVTVGWHARALSADASLPVGDAGGHLMNVVRALHWLQGGPFVAQAFPPAVYVLGAALAALGGPSLDHVTLAVALFGGLLGATLSWIGWRASGWAAAGLLPLLALSAPFLSGMSRLILLDLPATACITLIWALVWEGQLFRRRLPTLLLGLLIGLATLVKYTFFLWVLPLLLLAGLGMALRAPASLLPLALLAPPLRQVAEALLRRAEQPSASAPRPGELEGLCGVLGAAALVELGLLGLSVWRLRRGRSLRWRDLGDGAVLGLSALLAVAVALPWLHLALPEVWIKVHHEAIAEVRSAGREEGARYAATLLMASWPGGWWALVVAIWIELLVPVGLLAWALWPRLRLLGPLRRRWPPLETPAGRRAVPPWLRVGPALPVALSGVAGAALTMETLPVDPRYFLPILVGASVLIGLGACRLRALRWTFGFAVALGCLASLAAGEGLGPASAERLSMEAFRPSDARRAGPWALFAPPAPRTLPWLPPIEALLAEVAARSPVGADRRVLLVVPAFGEGRSAGLEDRSLVALLMLHGLDERAIETWSPPEQPGGLSRGSLPALARPAAWLAIAGLRPAAASAATAALGERAGEPVFVGDAGGRAVRLISLAKEAAPPPSPPGPAASP